MAREARRDAARPRDLPQVALGGEDDDVAAEGREAVVARRSRAERWTARRERGTGGDRRDGGDDGRGLVRGLGAREDGERDDDEDEGASDAQTHGAHPCTGPALHVSYSAAMQATPPGYAPPPPRTQGGGSTWIIVLMSVVGGVVVIIGVLAVLAVYGMRKYIGNAKQAEARNSLGQIAKDAATAYERESLASGTPDGLCASASHSVPASASMIRGMKYQSASGDWEVDASKPHAGFACLGFSLGMPQYYMYSYKAHGTKAPGDRFRATANGDINGDGVMSTFWITGNVGPGDDLAVDPLVGESQPTE